MRFVAFWHPPHLPKSWHKVYAGRVAGLATKTTPAARAAYLDKRKSWKLLKNWLSRLIGAKCWYCEAKSSRAPLDVDHFRPKLGVTVDRAPLANNFGYYWLAYEWWNFRLSCQRCNRPEKNEQDTLRGKWNEFPLEDENTRCLIAGASLADERPRLLDPCVQTDCDLLAHGLDGEVKPAAPEGSWEFERARYTIVQLGLNDWNAPEDRRGRWQPLFLLISLLGDAGTAAAEEVLKAHMAHDHEFSSFFRSAIGTHREKQWIAALL